MSESLKDIFFAECEDLLEALTTGLESLRSVPDDNDTVNAIFRAVHSIKGAAGAFALDALVKFAHKFETVLDHIRSGQLEVDDQVLRVSTRAADVLADLIEAARDDSDAVPDAYEPILGTLAEIADTVSEPEVEAEFTPMAFGAIGLEPISTRASYQVLFSPEAGLYANGHDPILLFQALAELGDLTVSCDSSELPALSDFVVDDAYLGWTLSLTGDVTEGEIREVFAFVEGLCSLSIDEIPQDVPPMNSIDAEPPAPFVDAPESDGVPLAVQPTEVQGISTSGNVAENQGTGSARQPPQVLNSGSSATQPRATLRVDPEKVDRLINTVGELIINQAVITQKLLAAGVAKNSDVLDDLDVYRHLARDIQEAVMSIRAQPVKPLFQRMSRIAREAADAIGKEVELVLVGEGTEVDKSVVERLADPLTHMIRNAIDHGIESREKRIDAGKPPDGKVILSAAHRSGHVLIEISDDGGGVDRARVFEIAVNKGLISADAKLSDPEIDALLFMPGFSTAQAVTNLSGRGVGMDVVKTTINSLGGRVGITSTPGKGSVFSITLPLTLAVLDGMVVQVAGQTMVLPLSSIVETTRLRRSEIISIGPGARVMSVRGAYIPVVGLGETLGLPNARDGKEDQIVVLVQPHDGAIVALAVDSISDQRQVVIKSIEGNYGKVPGVSAATILGDGKIALIVDIDAIIGLANDKSVKSANSNWEISHGRTLALGR